MVALTVDFRKHSEPTPADDMAAQIITDCGNFTLDFKEHGLCAMHFFQSTLHLICFKTALLEQPPLSVMTRCDNLFVEGVNDRLLDHCQVNSVPHYCGFREQEIPRIYTGMDGNLLKLKCKYSNILRYWFLTH